MALEHLRFFIWGASGALERRRLTFETVQNDDLCLSLTDSPAPAFPGLSPAAGYPQA